MPVAGPLAPAMNSRGCGARSTRSSDRCGSDLGGHRRLACCMNRNVGLRRAQRDKYHTCESRLSPKLRSVYVGGATMGTQIEFADRSGSIYLITRDGDLLWYGDMHRDGTPGWAPNSGNRIGWGWQDVRIAFSGGEGIIYAIRNNGDLAW